MTGAPADLQTAETVRRALAALEQMRQRLQDKHDAEREPIAITGIGCRFPGVEDATAFERLLASGQSIIGPVPKSRQKEGSGPRTAAYQNGGFLSDVASFDAKAFGISDSQALAMDPHLRVLLEVTRDALEDACLPPETLKGTRTGVYLALGAQNNDYAEALVRSGGALKDQVIEGSFHSLMPGRLSYHFDLRGPSFVVDAACASALVAVDLACQALRNGSCDTAIVASVNLVLSDQVSAAIDASGLWSRTGGVHAFSDKADGFVRGEGAGVLVLKRMRDAQEADAPMRAAILAAVSGQDGRSNGLAAPNGPAQVAIMERALAQAGRAPSDVAWVEAHATGTPLGDAIEAEAIAQVYGSASRGTPVGVGALKPVLGHLEAASGMAALIKTALARASGVLPTSRAPDRLNPELTGLAEDLSFDNGGLSWPENAPLAGVSAFGMSGTNAHVLLGPVQSAAVQGALAPHRFTRSRYWPEFARAEDPAGSPAQPLREAWFTAPAWREAELQSEKMHKRVALIGGGPLADRVAQWLAPDVAECVADALALPADCDAVILPAGRSFADLEAIRATVAALSQTKRTPQLVIATIGGTAGNPLAAAAIALGRSIAAEHPELRPRAVDIDDQEAADPQAVRRALLSSPSSGGVRVTDTGFLAPILKHLSPKRTQITLDPVKACLITGGFGGIGRAVARRLVTRGAKHLILLGRNAVMRPEHRDFEDLGVTVTRAVCDVADKAAVAEVFARASDAGHPIAHVFHTAGIVANDLLSQQTAKAFASPFRAKLLGASVLDSLTRDAPVTSFVLFSSLTAFVPLVGAGAYGAANASLGAIARGRQAQGHPASCLHWGTWATSGMLEAADGALADDWEAHGIHTMAQDAALDAMEAAVAEGAPETVIADCDWEQIAAHARREGSDSGLFQALIQPDAAPVSDKTASESIAQSVYRALGTLAKLAPDDPRIDAPFGELGVNSLAAIELRNALSEALDMKLPASLAFNFPSAPALIAELERRNQRRN